MSAPESPSRPSKNCDNFNKVNMKRFFQLYKDMYITQLMNVVVPGGGVCSALLTWFKPSEAALSGFYGPVCSQP